MRKLYLSILLLSLTISNLSTLNADSNRVFEEVDGLLVIEAEHFYKQGNTEHRKWYLTNKDTAPDFPCDADDPHVEGASGSAYIEVLPDTRHNHDHKMVRGENFTDKPGAIATLHYKTYFNTPGRYYIWLRIYSSNSEDDAVHVGFDGEWPETSIRWRSTINDKWGWSKKRRYPPSNPPKHGSLIAYIEVDKAGEKDLQISMREDGAELDKILLTLDENYTPEGQGPEFVLK